MRSKVLNNRKAEGARRKKREVKTCIVAISFSLMFLFFAAARTGAAQEPAAAAAGPEPVLELQPLIDEALRNNHDVLMAEAKWKASTHRIGQVESLPDPMLMFGYQNEGWDKYTYGKMQGAQWMYSLSQTFPFPGKRGLKGEMASRDADSSWEAYRASRLRTIETVKELYYDLFLAYREIDLVRAKTALFSRIEEAAIARYSSGMAPQQEVLMAQTEKYMLLEKETMLRQKARSGELMLVSALGGAAPLSRGKPAEPAFASFPYTLDDVIAMASDGSPEVRSRLRMKEGAEAKVRLAEKEYYPDVTLAANVYKRTGEFQDMWSVTATFNIPLHFEAKKSAVAEAASLSAEAEHDLAGTKAMLISGISDAYSMMKTAESLMDLYRQGLIPKTSQDFTLALAGYTAGRVEAGTVISRLKALLDYETLYWSQVVEREKAIARLDALAGIGDDEAGVKE